MIISQDTFRFKDVMFGYYMQNSVKFQEFNT